MATLRCPPPRPPLSPCAPARQGRPGASTAGRCRRWRQTAGTRPRRLWRSARLGRSARRSRPAASDRGLPHPEMPHQDRHAARAQPLRRHEPVRTCSSPAVTRGCSSSRSCLSVTAAWNRPSGSPSAAARRWRGSARGAGRRGARQRARSRSARAAPSDRPDWRGSTASAAADFASTGKCAPRQALRAPGGVARLLKRARTAADGAGGGSGSSLREPPAGRCGRLGRRPGEVPAPGPPGPGRTARPGEAAAALAFRAVRLRGREAAPVDLGGGCKPQPHGCSKRALAARERDGAAGPQAGSGGRARPRARRRRVGPTPAMGLARQAGCALEP